MFDSLADVLAFPGSEFWSALVGAIVGGLIAYFIQRGERKAAQREREQDRKAEARAQGYALLFKALSIDNALTHIRAHVDERLASAKEKAITQIASVLLPIVNLPTPVEFLPTEMALLLSLKDDEVFNAILSLDKIHNSIIPVWQVYHTKRSGIPELGENHTFDGTIGKGEFLVPRGSILEARIWEVEKIAEELVRRSVLDQIEAQSALQQLVPLLNQRLQLGVKVTDASSDDLNS